MNQFCQVSYCYFGLFELYLIVYTARTTHTVMFFIYLFDVGAYKADLFRLCVLLIEGGIYSDVDVELTSDLDQLIEDDIGFIIPVDEVSPVIYLILKSLYFYVWNAFTN
jgi:hypothetical protein